MLSPPHSLIPLPPSSPPAGADLQNLMNEAAILAARRNLKEISKDEIADALERIVAGPEKKGAVVSEKKRKLVSSAEKNSRMHSIECIPCIARGRPDPASRPALPPPHPALPDPSCPLPLRRSPTTRLATHSSAALCPSTTP